MSDVAVVCCAIFFFFFFLGGGIIMQVLVNTLKAKLKTMSFKHQVTITTINDYSANKRSIEKQEKEINKDRWRNNTKQNNTNISYQNGKPLDTRW